MKAQLIFKFLVCSIVFWLSSCHFFDDFEDTPEGCPFNSGYPCPCDPEHKGEDDMKGRCDDGALCIYLQSDDEKGICAKICNYEDDCWDGPSYGLDRRCIGNPGEEVNLCFIVCEDRGDLSSCPPGLECTLVDADTGLCYPPAPDHSSSERY